MFCHRLRNLALILTVLLTTFNGLIAQNNPKRGTLLLSGKVVDENKKGLQSKIQAYRNREKVNEISTSKIGKFQLALMNQDSVAFVVVAGGHVSKTIVVTTRVPEKKEKEDFLFPFFVDLYPVGKTPSYVDLDRPVGKIKFSGIQFIYDLDYTKKANADLKDFVKERKDLKVRKLEN